MTRRATVEVFDPASKRDAPLWTPLLLASRYTDSGRISRKRRPLLRNTYMRTTQKTPSSVKNACLLTRYLTMDKWEAYNKHLLRRWFYCCVGAFRSLPRNDSTCHNYVLTNQTIIRTSRKKNKKWNKCSVLTQNSIHKIVTRWNFFLNPNLESGYR
jgi:hypothetical protein